MFIDFRYFETEKVLHTEVCIVGGGVAGITLALELEKSGIDCCLIESGGFDPDNATRDLYRGQNLGLPYVFSDGCRSRFLGGSSNCWGGWSRPLDPWDFEKRDWIPYSGWPFGLDELMPFYLRSHNILKLGPPNYDPSFWEAEVARKDVCRIPLLSGKIRDSISQFSLPVRFGKFYRAELRRSKHIRVFLYANLLNINTDTPAQTVSSIEVASLSGRKICVKAKQFILATGGIENARLLLASNKSNPNGLGNNYGLVGRFFMDHPRMLSGHLRFHKKWSRNKLYDIKYHYMNSSVAAHGTHIAAQLALMPQILKEERLLNSRVWFSSIFPGEGSLGSEALYRCKQAWLKKEQVGWSLRHDLRTMLTHPADTFLYGFTRLVHPRFLIKGVKFQIIVEPEPDPDSRVTLSQTEKDQLGIPRVQIEWRLNSRVQRTFDRTLALISEELRLGGVAETQLDPPIEGGPWPSSLEIVGTWHHMGTTRMHNSPSQGVVNQNCKIHGMSNLYVAGSSVFPTAGANFPTMTIVALTLKLAEHLTKIIKTDKS